MAHRSNPATTSNQATNTRNDQPSWLENFLESNRTSEVVNRALGKEPSTKNLAARESGTPPDCPPSASHPQASRVGSTTTVSSLAATNAALDESEVKKKINELKECDATIEQLHFEAAKKLMAVNNKLMKVPVDSNSEVKELLMLKNHLLNFTHELELLRFGMPLHGVEKNPYFVRALMKLAEPIQQTKSGYTRAVRLYRRGAHYRRAMLKKASEKDVQRVHVSQHLDNMIASSVPTIKSKARLLSHVGATKQPPSKKQKTSTKYYYVDEVSVSTRHQPNATIQIVHHDDLTGRTLTHDEDKYSVSQGTTNLVKNRACEFTRKNYACYVFDGSLIAFGGENPKTNEYCNDLWHYCFAKDSWKLVEIKGEFVPTPRTHALLVTHSSGTFLYGGKTMKNNWLNDLWNFDWNTHRWHRILQHRPLPALNLQNALMNINQNTLQVVALDLPTVHILDMKVKEVQQLATIRFTGYSLFHILEKMPLADTTVKLKDGTAQAHAFVLNSLPKLVRMMKVCVEDEASSSVEDRDDVSPKYEITLDTIDTETFIKYIRPAMYGRHVTPPVMESIPVVDIAQNLGLFGYRDRTLEVLKQKAGNQWLSLFEQCRKSKNIDMFLHHFISPFISALPADEMSITLSQIMDPMLQASLRALQHAPRPTSPENERDFQHSRKDVTISTRDGTARVKMFKALLAAMSSYLGGVFDADPNVKVVYLDCEAEVLLDVMAFLEGSSRMLSKERFLKVLKLVDFLGAETLLSNLISQGKILMEERSILELQRFAARSDPQAAALFHNSFDEETIQQLRQLANEK